MMTLNSVSTRTPKLTTGDRLLVVAEKGPDEAVDGGEGAGGFARGEDDEILVLLVVIELDFVVFLRVLLVGGRRRGIADRPARRLQLGLRPSGQVSGHPMKEAWAP